ncbi:MAG: hypothetical protein K2X82_26450 [Gemmataceae bacterium]|nr:hypothetical protein [Gemmataceae bacterium]
MGEMTDDDVMRLRLQQVASYRQVCTLVRAGAGHTLINAALIGGLTYFQYTRFGPHPFLLVNAAFALGELLVGLWKKARPTIDAVLVDGLVVGGFGLWVLGRQLLVWQAGGRVFPFSVVFGVWMLFDAVRTLRAYGDLRRLFPVRPSRAQLAWFDDLAAETRAADPREDDRALDLPTQPHWKGQLLGSTAFLVAARGEEVWVAGPGSLEIDRHPEDAGTGRRPAALRVNGVEYPEFPLDDASWDNYRTWAEANARAGRPAGEP